MTTSVNHPAATAIATATDIYTARTVLDALRAAGWIVVRHDAIRLAQAAVDAEWDERYEELRRVAFKRGELLDEIGIATWEAAARRLEEKAEQNA